MTLRAGFFRAVCCLTSTLVHEPSLQDFKDIIDLLFCERLAAWDAVPFGQAFAATRARRVLGDENRMVPHWRLPSVIDRIGLC